MTWPIAVALLSAGCNGAIGVLAYLRGRSSSLYRSFSVLSFSFAFWSLAYLTAWPELDDPFRMKLLYTPLAWIPGATLSFVWSYTGLPESSRRRRVVPLYLAGYALLGMLWTQTIALRTYRIAFLAGGVPIFALGVALLFLHWLKAQEPAERNRRGYLLAATCIAVAGGLSDFFHLAKVHFPGPGNLSLMLYSLIVLAAIGRHHLLDLRAATGRALIMGAASVLLSLALSGIAWLTHKVEGPLFLNFFLLSLTLLALIPPLWERLDRAFGRWFSAREARRDRAIAVLERSLEGTSDLSTIDSKASEAVHEVWGAGCEVLWALRSLRGLEGGAPLPESLASLLADAPPVATLDSLARDDRTAALRQVLLDRHADALVCVRREGELVGAAFLGAPLEGFYDLAAVRWLERLCALLGRAVQSAELAAGLLRADRLAQLGTLAAGVAHEVRNPLSAMAGAAELLGQPLDDAKRREYLDVLKEEIQRLDGIVRDLLEYASPGVKDSRCAWAEVWPRVELLVKADWPSEVALTSRGEPLELAVGAPHLQQILLNLLRNALRAVQERRPAGPEGAVALSRLFFWR